jgi:hypothetical protein
MGASLRKNLTVVPVYAADACPGDQPIEFISPAEADLRVASGAAISLKGRAIRTRKPRSSNASRSPGERAMERYLAAKLSGRDPGAINAIEIWGRQQYVEAVRTVSF